MVKIHGEVGNAAIHCQLPHSVNRVQLGIFGGRQRLCLHPHLRAFRELSPRLQHDHAILDCAIVAHGSQITYTILHPRLANVKNTASKTGVSPNSS